jgi:hypothetical protein
VPPISTAAPGSAACARPRCILVESFDSRFQPSVDERLVRELCTGRFIGTGANVPRFGPPGVGKTHFAIAIAIDRAVIEVTSNARAQHQRAGATRCAREGSVRRAARREALEPCEAEAADHPRTGLPAVRQTQRASVLPTRGRRYERGSLLITTNQKDTRWGVIVGDAVLAAAISTASFTTPHAPLAGREFPAAAEAEGWPHRERQPEARASGGGGGHSVTQGGNSCRRSTPPLASSSARFLASGRACVRSAAAAHLPRIAGEANRATVVSGEASIRAAPGNRESGEGHASQRKAGERRRTRVPRSIAAAMRSLRRCGELQVGERSPGRGPRSAAYASVALGRPRTDLWSQNAKPSSLNERRREKPVPTGLVAGRPGGQCEREFRRGIPAFHPKASYWIGPSRLRLDPQHDEGRSIRTAPGRWPQQ